MIKFFVPGLPKAKGNHRAFVVPGTNRAYITEKDSGMKSWAGVVSGIAIDHRPAELWTFPVTLRCVFCFPPPQYMLKGKKQHLEWFHTKKPDLDKIVRCIKDCLTNVIYKDDSYVVEESLAKTYGFIPGVSIELEESMAWGFVPSQHPHIQLQFYHDQMGLLAHPKETICGL